MAAHIVIRTTGGSVGAWARQILHWRVKPRWYLYALGLPAVLFAAVNGVLGILGTSIDLSLLAERAPSYLAGFAFVMLLGGGQEEPDWRGFALPRLEQRLTPLRATLLLAVLWGLWHLPIYGIGFVGPMLFTFFYTYLPHGGPHHCRGPAGGHPHPHRGDPWAARLPAQHGSCQRPREAGKRPADRKEKQMTTAPQTFASGAVLPAEAIHVTGRRVVATIIDGFIFGVAYWLLAVAFGDVRTEGEAVNWVSNLPAAVSVAYGLFVIGYYVLLEGYLGQTLGKMATGIKVVSEATGATPGIAAAAIRTVLRLIDGLFSYLVAFATVLASAKRQRLGDMAARTLVVRT